MIQLSQNPFTLDSIPELKTILYDLQKQNQQSRQTMQNLMGWNKNDNYEITNEDQQSFNKKLSEVYFQQMASKHQTIENTLRFSMHLLNELQKIIEQNQNLMFSYESLHKSQQNLLVYNGELKTKIDKIQEQNDHLTNKIQQVQAEHLSQISQIINQNNNETQNNLMLDFFSPTINRKNDFNYHDFDTRQNDYIKNNLTERKISLHVSPVHHNYSNNHNNNINGNEKIVHLKCENEINSKNQLINELQIQIKLLKDRVLILEQEINMKNSQLQISKLYYREKIDVINNQLSSARPFILDQNDTYCLDSVAIKDEFNHVSNFSRVQSVKSFSSKSNQSQLDTRRRKESFRFNFEEELYETLELNSLKRGKTLLQDVGNTNYSDSKFGSLKLHVAESIKSTQNSEIEHGTKKTICICASVNKPVKFGKYTSKGIQTCLTIAKPSNKIEKKSTKILLNQISQKQDPLNSSILDISLGNLFKGIFDYATKKIVTNRIKHKSINSILNNK